MLVDELGPRGRGWNILILGTDINDKALEKARRGEYGLWSFRGLDNERTQRYFRRNGNQWQIEARLRDRVTFRRGDLIREHFPDAEAGLSDFDLILCRNVFIYFGADNVAVVANKLAAALSEGGYLMTGHTELIGHRLQNLHSKLFAEGVVYQRGAAMPAVAIPLPLPIAAPPAVVGRNVHRARRPLLKNERCSTHAPLSCGNPRSKKKASVSDWRWWNWVAENLGVELASMQICDITQLSAIPCCPPHILGAMSLRGELLTLIDPRAALNLPPAPRGGKAVVASLGEQALAIAVDEVRDIVYLRSHELQPPPSALRRAMWGGSHRHRAVCRPDDDRTGPARAAGARS